MIFLLLKCVLNIHSRSDLPYLYLSWGGGARDTTKVEKHWYKTIRTAL